MNQKIKKILGVILFFVGGIYLVNALFIGETISWEDAIITRVMYLGVSLVFIVGGYFSFRTKAIEKTS